jgi:hypothetical protein
MYFIPFSPCGAWSEANFVHARKMKGSLRAGDGGQAPENGSGQGRRQNTQFHGFCVTVSGRFGWRHALVQGKSSDAQRGADAGFFQQKR